MKKSLKDYIYIILGTTIFSLGISWFYEPSGLVSGGVTGAGIIIKHITGGIIPLYLSNLLFNIPLFLISLKQRGFSFVKKSLLSVVWLSLMLFINKYIINPFNTSEDLFLSSLLSGVFAGIGIGYILRASASSGGTDMLAAIIKYKKPHFPIATLILILDIAIIIIGMFIFGAYKGLYAALSLYITTKIIDRILEGVHFAKAAYIFSDKYNEISTEIFKNLNRGNTAIEATGMYTKSPRKILYVVVEPKEIITLTSIVRRLDSNAFITITDVRRALGEGFSRMEFNSLS